MGKIWAYVFIAMTLIVALQFSGIHTGGNVAIGNMTELTFQNSTEECPGCIDVFEPTLSDLFDFAFDNIIGILAGLGVGLAVTFFAKAQAENIILIPFITTVLGLFIQVFLSILKYTNTLGETWASAIMATILVPFTMGYIMAMVDYFRGID